MERHISRRISLILVSLLAACDGSTAPGAGAAESDTVVVMTYNIFHDGESAEHGIAPWSERRDALVETIRGQMPDVLGLQEAEGWQVDWLLGELPGYAAIAHAVDPSIGDSETTAILYRSGELELLDSGHFWFSNTPDSPGSYGSPDFGGMSGPRMASWVRLRSGAGAFYVFNTHFIADGAAADPDLARIRSAELLVERVAARPNADDHFVVTGDLNTEPGGWPLRYLLGSRCESGGDCGGGTPEAEIRMTDAWASRHAGDDAGTRCNGVTGGDGRRVDYVLVGDLDSAAGDGPTISDAAIVHAGPECPSDHRPVVATVVLPGAPM